MPNNGSMLNGLTQLQKNVVQYPYEEGSTVKVVAGPGSGKTYTLLRKVQYMIESGIVRPDEILILSLTNRAVDNIVDKLLSVFEHSNSIGRSLDELTEIVSQIGVYTIHGLANRVVVENDGMINIIDDNGWRGLSKLIPDEFWKKRHVNMLTAPKLLERLLKSYKGGANATKVKDEKKYLEEIVKIMGDSKVLTNDDLIEKAVEVLTRNKPSEDPSSINSVIANYKVIIIDEFQDLYPSLLPIISNISKGKQLILFGDKNQSIYEFLGKNSSVMDKIEALHPKEKTYILELRDNFRCTPEIMKQATAILPRNLRSSEHNVVSKDLSYVSPIIKSFENEIDQFEFLTQELRNLLGQSAKLSDIAVLSRTNSHLGRIADHFDYYNIPFKKCRTQPEWLEDSRILFLINLLKLTVLRDKDRQLSVSWESDFSGIVTLSLLRGVGNKSIQSLKRASTLANSSFWQYITEVDSKQWPSSVSNKQKIKEYSEILLRYTDEELFHKISEPILLLQELCELAFKLKSPLFQFQDQSDIDAFKANLESMYHIMKLCSLKTPQSLSLAEWFVESYYEQTMICHHSENTSLSDEKGCLRLSTIHSSKGLEFPITFLVNSPLDNFTMDTNTLYVGMTRARNLLYMLNTKHPQLNSSRGDSNDFIMGNTNFWNYYNKDLGRVGCFPHMHNINKSYPLASKISKRKFSTTMQRILRLIKISVI